MEMNTKQQASVKNAFISLLKAILIIFSAYCISFLVGVAVISPFFDFSIVKMREFFASPTQHEGKRTALLIFQAINHLIGFIGGSLAFLKLEKNESFDRLNPEKDIPLKPVFLTIFLVLAFMPLNSVIIEWNSNLDLPSFMSGFEQWAEEKEEFLKKATKYITNFTNFGGFTLGLLVIGIIPAIGEELLFRGIIQRKFLQMTGNPHAAIWLAAIVFSGIHMQFFGFFPRMLLGALFGYLYIWSGNIWIPIMAHFVNNSFTLLMMYMYQKDLIGFNIESTQAMSVQSIIFSVILSLILLLYIRDYYSFRRQS